MNPLKFVEAVRASIDKTRGTFRKIALLAHWFMHWPLVAFVLIAGEESIRDAINGFNDDQTESRRTK